MSLTHKQLEMHGCVISIVATDVLVLKHQALGFNSADLLNYQRFIQKYYIYKKLSLHFGKIEPAVQGLMEMVSNQIFKFLKAQTQHCLHHWTTGLYIQIPNPL